MATTSLTISAQEAPELIIDVLKAKRVPYMASSPGIGKSAIIHQIAKKFNLKIIDMRLAGSDPTDLNGFPQIVNGRAQYMPFSTFPIEGDSLPIKSTDNSGIKTQHKYYAGWLLLLDELPSAPKAVQAACYQLILDRMTGQNKLHDKVMITACGNLLTDGAIVNALSTALESRMVHFELEFCYDSFINHAVKVKFDYRILAYLRYQPSSAYKFKRGHGEKTYPCPRTWEFMSDIIKPMKIIGFEKQALLTGTVGQGVGMEFFSFCQLYTKLPSLSMLLANPSGIPIDTTDMAIMHALASLIEVNMAVDTADALIQLVERMPMEFQVLCIQNVAERDTALAALPPVINWMLAHVDDFISDNDI